MTVFVTVSRGAIARNILQTRFLEHLTAQGADVVVLTPAAEDAEFRAAFGRPGVTFAPLLPHRWTRLDFFFAAVHKLLVYNETRALVDRYGIYGIELHDRGQHPAVVAAKKALFVPLSRFPLAQRAVRWLDNALVKPTGYDALFAARKPSVVFSTNPIDDADTDVLKTARLHGVPAIVFPKSWDNLSKMNFRVAPDLLLLWGPALIAEARRFHHLDERRVRVVGAPQVDIYGEPDVLWTRADFFRHIGADPARPLVVFGSEGKISPDDGDTAEILHGLLQRMPGRPQLFVRPYYALDGEEKKFARLDGREGVIIDRFFARKPHFRDHWDWSRAHAIHYANLMAHLDVLVCSPSTLTLDAAYRDKPVVNIAFDGRRTLPYGQSIRRWFDSTHYKALASYGAMAVARTAQELGAEVADALAHPERRAAGRAALCDAYCPRLPGGSGAAIADAVLSMARTPTRAP